MKDQELITKILTKIANCLQWEWENERWIIQLPVQLETSQQWEWEVGLRGEKSGDG
jgi:hypothetical protein